MKPRLVHHGRLAPIALVCALFVLLSSCGGSSSGHSVSSSPTRTAAPGPRQRAPTPWLGLNYNSSSRLASGALTEFSSVGIAYDRLGPLEVGAGTTPSSSRTLASGLARSVRAGMIPDILIDTTIGPAGCTTNPDTSGLCLPTTARAAAAYATGFVTTMRAITRAYPQVPITFEPTDEPWSWGAPPGTQDGAPAAQQFATVLATLLPAVKAAGLSLSQVYVPATGELDDHTQWLTDLYAARPCLAPGPDTCGPVRAWNVHPYGPPEPSRSGIGSVPQMRALMRSGQNNIIISEIGFCSITVGDVSSCEENTSTVDGPSSRTAAWLTQVLQQGWTMHQAGWLKALIIWERSGGGWSMQLPSGELTAQGEALIGFAKSHR